MIIPRRGVNDEDERGLSRQKDVELAEKRVGC